MYCSWTIYKLRTQRNGFSPDYATSQGLKSGEPTKSLGQYICFVRLVQLLRKQVKAWVYLHGLRTNCGDLTSHWNRCNRMRSSANTLSQKSTVILKKSS